MVRRDTPLRLHTVMMAAVVPGVMFASIVLLALGFLSWAIYGTFRDENNTGAERRAGIERVFYTSGSQVNDTSPQMVALRKQTAQQFLETEKRGGFREKLIDMSGQEHKLIERMARTGEGFRLDTFMWRWSWYWDMWSPAAVLVLVLVIQASSVKDWWQMNRKQDCRLADLPWQQKWPWLLTLALGPVAWIAMTCSWFRLPRDYDQPTQADQPTPVLPTYVNDPEVARDTYVDLRTSQGERYRRLQLSEVGHRIVCAIESVRSLAQKIKDEQRELNELRAKQRALQAAADAVTDKVDPIMAQEEFDRILSLHEVIAVQKRGDGVRLVIRAHCEHLGVTYYLGDWSIDLTSSISTEGVNARLLSSGARPESTVKSLYGSNHCFGTQESVINGNARKGQFLEAVTIAINSLCSVNPFDRHKLASAFRVLSSGKLAEAVKQPTDK